jgi:hypothetical protein
VTGFCQIISFLHVLSGACAPEPGPAAFDLAAHGLSGTSLGQDWAAQAAATANLLLRAEDKIEFGIAGTETAKDPAKVPVHLVGGGLGPDELAMTPQGCRCVLLNTRAIETSTAELSGNDKTDLPINLAKWAAFILLHEAGHLAHGDYLPEAPGGDGGSAFARKYAEYQADEFAAQRIKEGSVPGHKGFGQAMLVSFELSNASWNLLADRLLDHFAASALKDASLVLDAGYSHPNFELRILIVNDLIQDNQSAHELRASFEAMREKASGGK